LKSTWNIFVNIGTAC